MKERPILFSGPLVRAILDGTKTQTRRIVNPDRLFVQLDREVRGDAPFGSHIAAKRGRHRAKLNAAGAVTLTKPELGVKPGEFHFACPFADGRTTLADYPAHPRGMRRTWNVRPEPEQRLWVRETWYCDDYTAPSFEDARKGYVGEPPSDDAIIKRWLDAMYYRADAKETGTVCELIPECLCDGKSPWKPGIHLPRWGSRIEIEVRDVRLERLQDITEDDAKAEGVRPFFEVYDKIGKDQRICTGELARDFPYRASFACLWDEINGERALWSSNPWTWVVEFRAIKVPR